MLQGGSKTFLKAIFGKHNKQTEEPAQGRFCDADRQVKEAERQGLFSFHSFIKDNDLGTTERRSNMAKRKEMPGRGKQRAKGRTEECESKRMISQGNERRKRPHWQAEDLGWNPDCARSYCLTPGPSFHIYLFIYIWQLCFKHSWRWRANRQTGQFLPPRGL